MVMEKSKVVLLECYDYDVTKLKKSLKKGLKLLNFDFSKLKKPVVYYQFDKEDFYGISHAYQKGIFDFDENGFGPVISNLEHLTVTLNNYVSQGDKFFKKYANRSQETFLSLDGKNSLKLYEELITT